MPLSPYSSTIHEVYHNPEPDAIVSRVQFDKENSRFFIRAFFPDNTQYIRGTIILGELRYYNFEGMLHGETEYSIKLTTNNIQLALFFIKELIRVSPGLSRSGIMEMLTNNRFSLDRAYQTAHNVPVWDIFHTNQRRQADTFEYTNSSAQATIRKIIVLHENPRTRFNVRVECSSDENFNALVSILAAENIIERRYHHEPRLGIYCHINVNDPQTIQHIRSFLNHLKSFEPLLDNTTYTALCRVINIASTSHQQIIPMENTMTTRIDYEPVELRVNVIPETVTNTEHHPWTQIGEWVERANHAYGPIRYVEFINSTAGTPVRKIFLSEYHNGDIKITLDIDEPRYESFRLSLIEQDLPQNINYYRTLTQISLKENYSNPIFLYSFIMKASQAEQSVGHVMDQLSRLISETISTRASQPRRISEPPINIRRSNSTVIRTRQLSVYDSFSGSRRSGNTHRHVTRGGIVDRVNTLLRDTMLDNDIQSNAQLDNALNQSFAEHYGHTGSTYRPSQSTAPASPDAGANAKALDGLDVEVPEHLVCPLSLQIMTNPVYFKNLPSGNIKSFEADWIKNQTKHPFTRESLTGRTPVVNEALAIACDKFTQNQIKKAKATI